MEQFWTIFWSAIGVMLMGLATWVSSFVTSWLSTKIKDKKLRSLAVQLNEIVMRAVMTITQTYVDNMKKQNAFDGEAQKNALNKCLGIINTQLTQELRCYIEDNFGDIKSYLVTLIESTIASLK